MEPLVESRNRRVLIVDDNRSIHDDFRKILAPACASMAAMNDAEKALFGSPTDTAPQIPFEVDSAYQGQEGALLVENALRAGLPYAMAFVDIRMPPGWDGLETTRRIWQVDPNVQIVLCTAYSDYSWKEVYESLGHSDGLLILKKPFDAIEAFQMANALTEKWRLHEQARLKLEELEKRVSERTRELCQTNAALETEVIEHERAEKSLQESQERFRGTFEQAAVGIAHVSVEGQFLRVNDKLCQIVGYGREELLGLTFAALTDSEDLPGGLDPLEAMRAGRISSFTSDQRYRRKNGDPVWANLITTLERTPEGEPKYFISVLADITPRKTAEFRLHRLNRLHKVLSKIGETIVQGQDSHALFETVCRILVEDGLLLVACVVELDTETGRVRPIASRGAPLEYLSEFVITTDGGPRSQGVVGTAFRTGLHQFTNNVATDPRMSPWRERALQHGFHSVAAFPLKPGGVVVAGLVLYAGEALYFQDDEIKVLVAVADNLSFALEAQQKERQRQQSEMALRASEARMAEAQAVAHFGSWEMDLANHDGTDTDRLHWSDEMFRIAGYAPGTVPISRDLFFRLAHPDDHELIRRALAAAILEHGRYSIVHRLIRPDGTERIVQEAARIFFDEKSGKPSRILGTATDITDQRKAEAALRESDERFHQLADHITDTFWIRSPDMRELYYVSPAFEKMWGRPADSLYANPEQWTDFTLPGDRQRVVAAFAALSRGEAGNLDIEYRIVRPDGEIRWVRARGFQVLNAAGQVARLIGIVTDISKRKEIEEAMRESEERFSGAFEHAPIGVALVSPDGRWLKVNRAFCALVGYSEAELRSRTFQDITHPDDLEPDLENMRRLIAGEIAAYQMEKRYIHARGHLVTVLLHVSLVRDGQGQPSYFISQVQDITERKRLEDQLFQSQKMETVGKLAGGVAHEFNSILTAIIGQSELMLIDLPAGNPFLGNVTEIRNAAERAAKLTRQLLAYGRKQMLRPEILDLNTVIASRSGMFRQLLGGAIEFCFAPAAGLRLVKVDSGQIEQVIANIVVNAADAMPSGGKLSLETANATIDEPSLDRHPELKAGDYVVITISDTGPGMSDAVKARVFEPFFTTKEIGQGAGLGLSTAYGIIKQSGGHLSFDSEVGRGSTFKIFLPRVLPHAGPPIERLDLPGLPRGTETILIVEDDSALREMVAALLRRLGYTVFTAASGREALSLKEQGGIGRMDLLLTDVVMPEMSGEELGERVRSLFPRLRVLFMSGYPEYASMRDGILKNRVPFLQKPFTPSALATRLREILDAPIPAPPAQGPHAGDLGQRPSGS